MARTPETAARYAHVRRLREAGATFDEIAAAEDPVTGKPMYANRATARAAWLRAAREDSDEPLIPMSDLDTLELGRLETLHRAMWPRAVRGETGAFDRILRIAELRAVVEARSGRHPHAVLDAYETTVAACTRVESNLDAALIELGRQYARRIDEGILAGNGARALYLGPHLMGTLRELLATPAARDAMWSRTPVAAPVNDDAGTDAGAVGAEAVNGGRRGVADFAAAAARRQRGGN